MNLINKYKVVIAVVLPILILVLIREFGPNHFKNNAKRWAAPSVTRTNIISGEQHGNLSGENLIINLNEDFREVKELTTYAVNIPADSILSKKNLNIIRNHDGPVVLFSSETALSARIWMVLSQMGYKNIFIFTNDSDNEVFKNKFRSDTLVRPEL